MRKLRWILWSVWLLVLCGIIAEPVSVGIFGVDPAAHASQYIDSFSDWLPWNASPEYVESDQWVKSDDELVGLARQMSLHASNPRNGYETGVSPRRAKIIQQLKAWNAEYFLLERYTDDHPSFRFLCWMSSERLNGTARRFETVAGTEDEALVTVYNQVKAWRDQQKRVYQARPVSASELTTLR